jgi:hypothetical protein
MNEIICGICAEPLNNKFKTKLKCNHEFHYECLQNSFKKDWLKMCPYCRSENNFLPLVNGIKKIDYNIHDKTNINNYKNILCDHILLTGKNKGEKCNKNCMLGEFKCGNHIKKKFN